MKRDAGIAVLTEREPDRVLSKVHEAERRAALHLDLEQLEGIPMEHGFHLLHVETGQRGSFEHLVQSSHSGEAGVDGRKRIVASEEDLSPRLVLLNQHKRVIELEWAVMERRAIGVHVRMLAHGGDAFSLVWMGKMRHDDSDLRKTDGDVVDEAREGAVDGRLMDEGCAGVQENRKMVASGILPEEIDLAVVGIEPGVHGHELDAF